MSHLFWVLFARARARGGPACAAPRFARVLTHATQARLPDDTPRDVTASTTKNQRVILWFQFLVKEKIVKKP